MSDEKEAKEVKDEELDKVSGGHGANPEIGHIKEDAGHIKEDAGVGGQHHTMFGGANKTK